MIIKIDAGSFEEKVLNAAVPVVVDVWAPWCGPCKRIEPIIEKLSQKFDGQVLFAKLNADDNQEVVKQYKIMGIPSLLFFNHGKLVNRKMGVQSEAAIAKLLTQISNLSAEEAAQHEITGFFSRSTIKLAWLFGIGGGILALFGGLLYWFNV